MTAAPLPRPVVVLPLLLAGTLLHAAEWSVPAAGNTFRTAPNPGTGGLQRNGTLAWSDPDEVHSIFFHVDRPATLDLALQGRVREGHSSLTAHSADRELPFDLEGTDMTRHPVGRVEVPGPGYVRVDLQGRTRTGPLFAEVRDLVVISDTEALALDYVRTNDGNMFYWGRRGPSVHLRYEVPRDIPLRFAYSEITVPEGQDPVGSFYMANGFAEGYFGIQVNGPDERRVLFSVWSPYRTDNPRDIPEDQRVVLLARGEGVRVGEFGNEGSGGQSYLIHPWKAGTPYRFLTEVRPDGVGNTIYTAWFGADGEWRLVASFQRPRTDTHLRGFHSFLESFNPAHGHIGRSALYGNVWVRDVDGGWHECTRARFSVDATGSGRHRLDFNGGTVGNRFLLGNCGFVAGHVRPGEMFTRAASGTAPPGLPDVP